MSEARPQLDALVIGAGIAGLWAARRLHDAGHHVAVLEREAVGAGQTLLSQGILHGGAKYTLEYGAPTAASSALAGAPDRWRACLSGRGELDLTDVPCVAEHTWLWADSTQRSALDRHAEASPAVGARPCDDDPPAFLRDQLPHVAVWRLDEPLIDVGALLASLAAPIDVLRCDDVADRLSLSPRGVHLSSEGTRLDARRLILAAGSGNEALLARLGRDGPAMQRRPLHQVCVDLPAGPAIHGHFVAANASHEPEPRITINTLTHADGRRCLYLGGAVASAGVHRSAADQIDAARAALRQALPTLDLTDAHWRTLRVDRAERSEADGQRPDQPCVHDDGAVMTLWPTKLAFAPVLGDAVVDALGAPTCDDAGTALALTLLRSELPTCPAGTDYRTRR